MKGVPQLPMSTDLHVLTSSENAEFLQHNPVSHSQFCVSLVTRRESFVMLSTQFHRMYELYYLSQGTREYFIHDRTYLVEAGSFVLIPPLVLHKTLEPADAGHSRLLFHFTAEDLPFSSDTEGWLGTMFRTDQPIHTPSSAHVSAQTEKLVCVAEALLTLNSTPQPQNELLLRSLLTQILVGIHEDLTEQRGEMSERLEPETSMPKQIQDVLSYLHAHHHKEITLDDLAERFFVSRSQLSRRFKGATGFTIIEYLNNTRIISAQQQLLDTSTPVARIAENVGFGSHSQFNRVFRSLTGMSATEFRKRPS